MYTSSGGLALVAWQSPFKMSELNNMKSRVKHDQRLRLRTRPTGQ